MQSTSFSKKVNSYCRFDEFSADSVCCTMAPLYDEENVPPLYSAIVDSQPVFIAGRLEASNETVVRRLIKAGATNVRQFVNDHAVSSAREQHEASEAETVVFPGFTSDGKLPARGSSAWDHRYEPDVTCTFPGHDAGWHDAVDQLQSGVPDPLDFIVRRFVTLKFSTDDSARGCQAWLAKCGFPAGALIVASHESWLCYRLAFDLTDLQNEAYIEEHGDSRHYRPFVDVINSRFGCDVEACCSLDASVPVPVIGTTTEIVADDDWMKWNEAVNESKLADVVGEAAIWNPGGLLQEWIDYTLRTAIKRQPELSMLAAVCGFATVIGRKVQDDFGVRPNIYGIGIAQSSAGKQHPMSANKLIIASAGGDMMLQDSLASHAGLHSALSASPSTLLQSDEMGRVMTGLADRQKAPPHLAGIIDIWLKMFSSSDTIYIAPAYADRKQNVRIANPNFCIYGTTVPGNFFAALTRESLSDGLFNRFLIVEASNGDPDPQKPAPGAVPESLIEGVKWWLNHNPGGGDLAPVARVLVTSPEAESEFNGLQKTVRKYQRAEEQRGTQVWGRAVEIGRKLALIHQCSLDREAVAIGGPSASWGCRLVMNLTARMGKLAESHVADGAFDSTCKKLRRFIGEAPGTNGRTRSEVSRHMGNLTSRDLDVALTKLVENGDVEAEVYQPAKGRPVRVYRAV